MLSCCVHVVHAGCRATVLCARDHRAGPWAPLAFGLEGGRGIEQHSSTMYNRLLHRTCDRSNASPQNRSAESDVCLSFEQTLRRRYVNKFHATPNAVPDSVFLKPCRAPRDDPKGAVASPLRAVGAETKPPTAAASPTGAGAGADPGAGAGAGAEASPSCRRAEASARAWAALQQSAELYGSRPGTMMSKSNSIR